MLGTIEELEKDIEQFQKNMAASSELQMLLKQVLEQIKQQNFEFDTQSTALISKVDNLPSIIENANVSSNSRIKGDVAAEIDRALQSFANGQGRYLQGLEQTKQQIQGYIERSQTQEKAFSDSVASAIAKFDETASEISADNTKANENLKVDIDKLLEERSAAFATEQNKYITFLQQTQEEIKNCESQLTTEYSEFIDTLQKMNISNLYDQNVQLRNELNKKTTILVVISAISIIIGIVGVIL